MKVYGMASAADGRRGIPVPLPGGRDTFDGVKKSFSGHLNVFHHGNNQTLPCPGNVSPDQVVCNMYR